MVPPRLVVALAFLTACYRQDPYAYQTFPEPTMVVGPPGGAIDPEWTQAQSPGYPDGYSPGTEYGYVEPSSDPSDPGYVMGTTTDHEIDATLDGYGEWIEIDGYGRVWRPYATVVGVDFTPYESCGSWVWTDWGWTFACDWEWGWLPFHYGRWGWFDDYWAWAPGYEWSPAWVEWRGGGGYVGWRPLAPTIRDHRGTHAGPTVRDHRGTHAGPTVRDHRTGRGRSPSLMDSHWRFSKDGDLGKRIRPHVVKTPAEGLRVTSLVTRPPVRPSMQPVRAASLMRGRLAFAGAGHVRTAREPSVHPSRGATQFGGRVPVHPPSRSAAFDRSPDRARSPSIYQPTYPVYHPPRPRAGRDGSPSSFGTPDRAATPSRPARPAIGGRPSYPAPDRAPPPSWSPPSRASWDRTPRAPDRAPPPSGSPPSRRSWERASRPSGSDSPSRSSGGSWSPPSRPSGGSWSPPSRPSSSSSSSSRGSSSRNSRGSSSSSSSSGGSSWRGSSSSSSSSGGSRWRGSSSSSGSSRASGSSWGGSSRSSGGSSSRSSGGGSSRSSGGGSRSRR